MLEISNGPSQTSEKLYFWRKILILLEIFWYKTPIFSTLVRARASNISILFQGFIKPHNFYNGTFAQIISLRNIHRLFHQTKAMSTSPTVFCLSRPVNSNSTCHTVKCVSVNGKKQPLKLRFGAVNVGAMNVGAVNAGLWMQKAVNVGLQFHGALIVVGCGY